MHRCVAFMQCLEHGMKNENLKFSLSRLDETQLSTIWSHIGYAFFLFVKVRQYFALMGTICWKAINSIDRWLVWNMTNQFTEHHRTLDAWNNFDFVWSFTFCKESVWLYGYVTESDHWCVTYVNRELVCVLILSQLNFPLLTSVAQGLRLSCVMIILNDKSSLRTYNYGIPRNAKISHDISVKQKRAKKALKGTGCNVHIISRLVLSSFVRVTKKKFRILASEEVPFHPE